MLQAGLSITQQEDPLKKVSVEYLANSIRHPRPEISSLVGQIRMIKTLDIKQYAIAIKRLPYFVCGIFNPSFRKIDNFAFIQYFLVDIDQLDEKGLSLNTIREMVQHDDRVVLCFSSTGEDGLKIMYKLDARCYDAGVFSLFYPEFVKSLFAKMNVEQTFDKNAQDVCRACHISEDPLIYFNPNPEPVSLDAYLDLNNPHAMQQLSLIQKKEFQAKQEAQQIQIQSEKKSVDPDKNVLSQIRQILQLPSRGKQYRDVYVPGQLEEIIVDLQRYIEATGVTVTEIQNIQYGKKIKMRTNVRQAEVNLFYGRKGFSVVISPRCGTSEELNKLVAELIKGFIDNNVYV